MTKRDQRLKDQEAARNRIPARVEYALRARAARGFDITGCKRWIGYRGKQQVLTPWAKKELKRRRAARKVAHESRRRNRACR